MASVSSYAVEVFNWKRQEVDVWTLKFIINELEFEDKKLTDPTEIAEGFNKFFAEIGPKLSENIEDTDTCFDKFVNQSISGNFSFQQISPSLVSFTYVNYAWGKPLDLIQFPPDFWENASI